MRKSSGGRIPAIEPRKHEPDRRRLALIEAATQVFADKGFEAATTREIAERANCSEGLIHRYFGGKRGLLLAALRHKSELIRDTVRGAVADEDDLHDEIKGLMLWATEFMWRQRDFMRMVCHQATIDADVGRVVGGVINAERVAAIREKLQRHQEAGRIRADVDIDVVAEMIAGSTFESGFFAQVVFQRPREEIRRIVREVAHLFVRAIQSDEYRDARVRREAAAAKEA